jgi:hypothetical protein
MVLYKENKRSTVAEDRLQAAIFLASSEKMGRVITFFFQNNKQPSVKVSASGWRLAEDMIRGQLIHKGHKENIIPSLEIG